MSQYRPFSPSVFGPYRKFYEDKLKEVNGPERASLSQVREEDRISEIDVHKEELEIEVKTKAGFSAYHKKQSIKFSKDPEVRRGARMTNFQEGIKNKRTQLLMEKRKCEPIPVVAKDKVQSSNGNINNPGNNRETAKETRKEQLLRWKREKEAVTANMKASAKPPFKGGQTNKPSGIVKGPFEANLNINKPRNVTAQPRPVPTRPDGLSKVVGTKDNLDTRRVTRAMTKTQPTVAVNPIPRPPISKMKTLAITKISSKGKSPPPDDNISPKKEEKKIPSVVSKEDVVTSSDTSVGVSKTVEVVVPIAAPKKLKPKAMDSFFIAFNQTFSKACAELECHSNEWKNIVGWPDIPEDVREDITCSIGRVNLLLDSKLPQFSQLLYSYICHETDPGPILPCDLQGWWDVAVIQVEAVKSQFEELKKMQMNGWKKELPVKPIKSYVTAKSENMGVVAVPRKSVKASKGIREFLARKRQNVIEPQIVEKVEEVEGMTKEPSSPEKKFEGGFFEVSSPLKRTPAPRMATRLSIVKGSPLTPSRRSSSTNMSLRMLSVRKSMGSICKIGVLPKETVEKEDINSNQ